MKSQHGIYIARLSRSNPDYDHRNSCQAMVTPDRSQMYAQVGIVTKSFNFPATVTLTPAEVTIINKLEARIAARLSNEIESEGVHSE